MIGVDDLPLDNFDCISLRRLLCVNSELRKLVEPILSKRFETPEILVYLQSLPKLQRLSKLDELSEARARKILVDMHKILGVQQIVLLGNSELYIHFKIAFNDRLVGYDGLRLDLSHFVWNDITIAFEDVRDICDRSIRMFVQEKYNADGFDIPFSVYWDCYVVLYSFDGGKINTTMRLAMSNQCAEYERMCVNLLDDTGYVFNVKDFLFKYILTQ